MNKFQAEMLWKTAMKNPEFASMATLVFGQSDIATEPFRRNFLQHWAEALVNGEAPVIEATQQRLPDHTDRLFEGEVGWNPPVKGLAQPARWDLWTNWQRSRYLALQIPREEFNTGEKSGRLLQINDAAQQCGVKMDQIYGISSGELGSVDDATAAKIFARNGFKVRVRKSGLALLREELGVK